MTQRLPEIDADLVRRFANGARQRAEMQAQIDRGEQPHGPRAEWLRAGSSAILRVVAEQCERFTAEHPKEAASLADALDLLWTARAVLLAMAPKTTAGVPR